MGGGGSLLQIIAIGEEDVLVHTTHEQAVHPFRQAIRRTVPYARELVDTQMRLPTNIVYSQTLHGNIPRKGDILTKIVIMVKMKRSGLTSVYPGFQIIKEARIIAGKQTLDTVTGEYCLIHHHLHDDASKQDAIKQLTGFVSDDPVGGEKWMYVELPFFLQKTPFPLIALQYQQLELDIVFGSCPPSCDPTVQPDVKVMAEYVYLSDEERLYFTRKNHEIVFERVLTQQNRIDILPTKIRKDNATRVISGIPIPDRVEGSGNTHDITTQEGLQLVKINSWPGLTKAVYDDAKLYTKEIDLQGTFSVPLIGDFGTEWCAPASGEGYNVRFVSTSNRFLEIYVSRQGETLAHIKDDYVWTNTRTTVQGESTSMDMTQQFNDGEAWLEFRITHDVENNGPISIVCTVRGYTVGDKLNGLSEQSSFGFTYIIHENISSYNPIVQTSTKFFGNSDYNIFLVDIQSTTSSFTVLPPSTNFSDISTQVYLRGPIRYIIWFLRTLDRDNTFGLYTTSSSSTNVNTAYDPMYEAKIMLNQKDRCDLMPSNFFSTWEPTRVTGKSLPAGLHFFSFGDSIDTIHPSGTLNASRIPNFVIFQKMKRYNETASQISELDESEVFNDAKEYKEIVFYAVQYNLLRILEGTVSIGFV
jgi:hypothetical protein